ncbi:hypothetical protein [Azospirillum canadense]|uniref:hypothetical protein n=1 Tax=Azospirillum canadense TaxID=403962 RepID=UPI002226A52F|nr:hypothetical protein [Azospirillum canadense]MCW2241921.1 hypothetical protein [Azospirillum canadense]
MTRTVRLIALAALATMLGTAGASAQLFKPQTSTTATSNLQTCRWVTYTTPYLYQKNTCTGQVVILVH